MTYVRTSSTRFGQTSGTAAACFPPRYRRRRSRHRRGLPPYGAPALHGASRPSRGNETTSACLLEIFFDRHGDHGADAGKGVDHDRQQRPVAQTFHGRRLDGVDQLPRFAG